MGDNGRQGETKLREGGHTIQQRETRRHPSKGNKKGDYGGDYARQGRQDSREGGHTIQQRETRRGTHGDKGRQDPRREAARRETKPREGGHPIQQRETRRKTRGDKTSGHTIQQRETRRAQWETNGDKTLAKKLGKEKQSLGKANAPSNKGEQ